MAGAEPQQLQPTTCTGWALVLKRPKKRLLKANAEQREAFVATYVALRDEAQLAGARSSLSMRRTSGRMSN